MAEKSRYAKRMNLDMPEDVAAWVTFAAAARDVSKIAYVNGVLRAAMEVAPDNVQDAFQAFLKTRDDL